MNGKDTIQNTCTVTHMNKKFDQYITKFLDKSILRDVCAYRWRRIPQSEERRYIGYNINVEEYPSGAHQSLYIVEFFCTHPTGVFRPNVIKCAVKTFLERLNPPLQEIENNGCSGDAALYVPSNKCHELVDLIHIS